MKKYCRILEEVEAIQATDSNLEELRDFAGDVKKVIIDKRTCCYTIPGVYAALWPGEWLIKHHSGRLEINDNDEFSRDYELK